MVSRNTVRSGPGRPTLVYRLTGQAEDAFPKDYDGLANELLTAIRLELGSDVVERICLSAAHRMAAGLRERFGSDEPAKLLEAYVGWQAAQGHLTSLEKAESGYFMHAYSCPYYRVAKTHREVCVLHRQMLRELVGAAVETVSCQVDGDQRCSHLVRVGVPATQPAAVRHDSTKEASHA